MRAMNLGDDRRTGFARAGATNVKRNIYEYGL
jgi:hypothetical protein